MDIADCYGDLFTDGYDDTDEEGNYFWHKYTDEEALNRMKLELDEGRTLYAGLFLNTKCYCIKESKQITLQSDYYLGQTVYTMKDNQIRKARIMRIWLSDGIEEVAPSANALAYEVMHEIESHINTPTHNHIKKVIDKCKVMDESMVYVYFDGHNTGDGLLPLREVFATKEELVERLLSE